jgi:hypothetical protein
MYSASTDREWEHWHAIWLFARGWTQTEVAEDLERDKHTIGEWVTWIEREGSQGLAYVSGNFNTEASVAFLRRTVGVYCRPTQIR